MKGIPKHLNTKFDYEYIRKNFPKEEYIPFFQQLLETEKAWFFTKELQDGEIGLSDDTHKIEIQLAMGENEKNKRYQYELKDNPHSLLKAIGYTKEEVQEIIVNG